MMESGNSEAGPSQLPSVDPEEMEMNGLTEEPKMSKSAMKKAARKARDIEQRPAKRAAEKERRKQRLEQQRAAFEAGTMTEEQKKEFQEQKSLRQKRSQLRKKTHDGKDGLEGTWKGGVVMDMGFDDLMTESEISSIHAQLSYCYSANRAAKVPISAVLHTSMNGRLKARMEGQGGSHGVHRKWSRCHWWDTGLESLQGKVGQPIEAEAEAAESSEAASREAIEAALAARREDGVTDACPFPPTHQLIYLSADSPNELTELSETEIYVVGGIVDKNRYKNLCQGKAEKLGIKTARLPIGTFIADLPTRKVLTVNHVFEILLQFIEKRDWKQAFDAVMPSRKFKAAEDTKSGKRRLVKLASGANGEGDENLGVHEASDHESDDGDDNERPRKKSRDEGEDEGAIEQSGATAK